MTPEHPLLYHPNASGGNIEMHTPPLPFENFPDFAIHLVNLERYPYIEQLHTYAKALTIPDMPEAVPVQEIQESIGFTSQDMQSRLQFLRKYAGAYTEQRASLSFTKKDRELSLSPVGAKMMLIDAALHQIGNPEDIILTLTPIWPNARKTLTEYYQWKTLEEITQELKTKFQDTRRIQVETVFREYMTDDRKTCGARLIGGHRVMTLPPDVSKRLSNTIKAMKSLSASERKLRDQSRKEPKPIKETPSARAFGEKAVTLLNEKNTGYVKGLLAWSFNLESLNIPLSVTIQNIEELLGVPRAYLKSRMNFHKSMLTRMNDQEHTLAFPSLHEKHTTLSPDVVRFLMLDCILQGKQSDKLFELAKKLWKTAEYDIAYYSSWRTIDQFVLRWNMPFQQSRIKVQHANKALFGKDFADMGRRFTRNRQEKTIPPWHAKALKRKVRKLLRASKNTKSSEISKNGKTKKDEPSHLYTDPRVVLAAGRALAHTIELHRREDRAVIPEFIDIFYIHFAELMEKADPSFDVSQVFLSKLIDTAYCALPHISGNNTPGWMKPFEQKETIHEEVASDENPDTQPNPEPKTETPQD